MIYNNVLEAVGNTPLIRLSNLTEANDAQVLVKFEGVNIGGSIKTRTALEIIEAAEKRGDLKKDYTIVEATSGNQGIGLSLVGAVKGYKVIIIMPDSVSRERLYLMRQYGAEVRLVHDDNNIGECMQECIRQAKQLESEDPTVYCPDQFSNQDNVFAHHRHTAIEILNQAGVSIDGFCSGIGTGGTITGVGQILKEKNPHMKVYAVEPENAAILSGGGVGTHLQMGIGDGVIPDILDKNVYDDICIVTDEEAIATTRALAAKEGLLCGISGGTNVCVALRMAKELGAGKTVVTILPDTGERYFSTPLYEA